MALGPWDEQRGYRFYVGADDDKVYCYQVSQTNGLFSVGANPVWTYTCDGDPVGTPVLGSSDGIDIVFVGDAACVGRGNSGALAGYSQSPGRR